MKNSLLLLGIVTPFLSSDLANGATTTFGTANDGLGGFTQSTVETGGSWSSNANSVGFTQTNNGLNNNSLLKEYFFDRAVGNSYLITGTLTWSAEADRNNRQGIYLFGGFSDLTAGPGENETGAIAFHLNVDDADIGVFQGIDNGVFGSLVSVSNVPATNSYFTDEVLTFQAEIDFVNNGGTDQIEMAFTLFDSFAGPGTTTYSTVTVDAADYTGNYFGFAGRTRNDGSTVPGDSIANYNSFSIVQTAVPEPSCAMLSGLLGAAAFMRRRR